MKYIREFNVFDEEIDLQSFCNINLAYLIDEGYRIYINNLYGKDIITIRIRKNEWNAIFKLEDIKDYIIPFLYVLNDKIKIKDIVLYMCDNLKSYTLDELESANLDDDIVTFSINIKKRA